MPIQEDSLTLTRFFDLFSAWEESVTQGSGISVAQMHLLEVLGSRGPLRMKEAALALGVQNGTLTVMVQRLEHKGLLVRKGHENDRRIQFLELSPAGELAWKEHHAAHEELMLGLEAGMGKAKYTQFVEALAGAGAIIGGKDHETIHL